MEPVKMEAGRMQNLQNSLMLFFTGSADHSRTILEEQETSTRSHSGSTVEALHEARSVADQMRQTLEPGDLSVFGPLLDEAWQAKKRVSPKISNLRIDHLYQLARQDGALGRKITRAAGGGGFLLLSSIRKACSARSYFESGRSK